MKYLNIMNEAFNRPVLLEPGYAGFFYAYLSDRVGADGLIIDGETLDVVAMKEKAGMYSSRDSEEKRRSFEIVNGVAIIPVMGTLMNRGGWMDSLSGACSYTSLKSKVTDAENDPDVKGHFFHFDSSGGAVAGCFDFCDFLATLSKPTAGFIDETCASACYAIASQLDKIYIPRTGVAGSVGVVWAHKDYSQQLDNIGVKVTLVHAGEHKVDGNPYEPLPESVRAEVQTELDETHQLFATTVANGRNMTVGAVLATEARMYTGQSAVDIGFVDAVMSQDQAFETFLNTLSNTGGNYSVGVTMSEQQAPEATSTQATTESVAQGFSAEHVTEQVNAAVSAEQTRIFGIIGHESAQGRMATAIQLAQSGMSVDNAAGVLATVPVEQGQTAASQQNQQALAAMADAEVVDVETESEGTQASAPTLRIIP